MKRVELSCLYRNITTFDLSITEQECIKRIASAQPLEIEDNYKCLPSDRSRVFNNGIGRRSYKITNEYRDMLFDEDQDYIYENDFDKVFIFIKKVKLLLDEEMRNWEIRKSKFLAEYKILEDTLRKLDEEEYEGIFI